MELVFNGLFERALKILVFLFCLSVLACQPKSNNSNGSTSYQNQMRILAASNSCLQTTTSTGFPTYLQTYNWAGNYNAQNFCGCAAGSFPACSAQYGMICVPVTQQVPNVAWFNRTQAGLAFAAYNGWGYASYNVIPATGVVPANMANNCFSHVGQACDVNVYGSCGAYGNCYPVQAGNPVGVCGN